jgi:4-hydroxy-tetrahydrodipicolinate reductase
VIRVAVAGAAGRMGQMVCATVDEADDLSLAGRADPVLDTSVEDVLGDADVLVDFTRPDTALDNARAALAAGVHVVIGTSGFDLDGLREAAAAAEAKAFFAPNFAIGAVLMMRFAELAAPWFETAEVIELHHDQKVDAPSGTAMLTVERMAKASGDWAPDPTKREVLAGARGATGPGGIPVHSVRLRGLVAHQEVLLGTMGQSLTIRHDSYDRASFMPGVVLAVKQVAHHPGLTVGLDSLLGL